MALTLRRAGLASPVCKPPGGPSCWDSRCGSPATIFSLCLPARKTCPQARPPSFAPGVSPSCKSLPVSWRCPGTRRKGGRTAAVAEFKLSDEQRRRLVVQERD
jgi:hypothetical protein